MLSFSLLRYVRWFLKDSIFSARPIIGVGGVLGLNPAMVTGSLSFLIFLPVLAILSFLMRLVLNSFWFCLQNLLNALNLV